MNAQYLKLVPSISQIESSTLSSENDFGETPLNFAPTIRLANGQYAVPQQYLEVSRTLDNLSNVIAEITTPTNFQLFAGQEGSCLFLVVAVIGLENYKANEKIPGEDKIVYGRRWLIEESTPTSEIVQTAMLAVKKAREHELRELLTFRIDNGCKVTTPFNCHLDLPLLAGNQSVMSSEVDCDYESLLANVRIAGKKLKVVRSLSLGDKKIIDVSLMESGACHFEELIGATLTIVCEQKTGDDFLHQLMAQLIKHSDRFVEEQVIFKGFKRFSHEINVQTLAEFSYQTRNVEIQDSRFDAEFDDMSYRVDAAKAPEFNSGKLGDQQRELIRQYDCLGGYLPR